MNLESQQVNLELSQQLKEAGYKQEGIWWWDLKRKKEDCDIGDKPEDEWVLSYEECYQGDKDDLIVAPTVAELGERLPSKITLTVIAGQTQIHYLYTTKCVDGAWVCFYAMNNGQTKHHIEEAYTEADARAKMWLYLKKENLL